MPAPKKRAKTTARGRKPAKRMTSRAAASRSAIKTAKPKARAKRRTGARAK